MYLINYFVRTQSIFLFLLPFLLLSFLAGCQGGINNGVSSHVSTGAKNTPLAQSKPLNLPKPTPTPVPQVNESQPAPTSVKVLTADPQQGIPLGDNTQVEMDSIQPQPVPKPAPAPVPKPAPTPVPKPAPVPVPIATPVTPPVSIIPPPAPVSVAVQEAVEEPVIAQAPEQNWLERYPNLSEDLKNYQQTITQLEKEAKAYQNRINELQEKVQKQWGGVAPKPTSAHQFVKYTDAYQSRGEMDFDNGKIVVETIDPSNPKQHLREAIITTLLTPYDAENPEIYTDKKINYVGPALLAGQVLDHEGEPVKWEWRAERFADYLVDNKVQEIQRNGQVVYRVEIPLVENHTQVRGHQYEHLVRTAAERYGIDEVLIYAIIETESHFNPYATSHIPAYGLMQVVPSTAGKDVFTRIKKRNDQPTRDYLFNTTNNIDTGTAYLSILRDNYLNKITHPLSREYAMISGYNGGAGNVLRTFHQDRAQAVNVINQLTPQQVYNQLHLKHPRAEARGYIKKVTEAQQRYRTQGSTASR
ncbi:MAG TPA: membrane-bound lytic murein transglycosylase MltC [Marinospirillum sp.]|uniref:membrane-bound lytic murein transglycosylase MltC n=1 Tax=Marinospirillum sp. TaxID=2183934 RepID=UPI002B46C4BE|nr:membrane-bound lytic murein transglycosylase MltC [Marinospirillum sp.]HKM14360.1 membrane-bound lytic murein transglycosylase MltC [Marinospirillum sp.]